MDILLSAVLGELATRSIDFFISKCSESTALDVEYRLCRVLLRAQIVIDEAMGRHITNQAMLLQLDMLRDAMHRGSYMLDVFRCQSKNEEDANDQVMGYSSSLSKVNSLKSFCFSSRNTQILKQLQEAIDDLSSMILDVKELVLFLTSYPHLYRQPYSMHLLVGNCMFGRHMEAELVINYLLHTQSHGAEELGILPIVGPSRVGKSTLVSHVCKDERVRDHFSEIMFLCNHDLRDGAQAIFSEGRAIRYQYLGSSSNEGGKLLVAELDRDLDEDSWNRLYSAFREYMPTGGKIILTSQSDKIVNFGTTHALTLKYLSLETYWCFFKMLTFGSMDPKTQPRLTHLAMKIAKTMGGCFIGANITTSLLREKFDFHFWCKVLSLSRGNVQKHVSRYGKHPFNLDQNRIEHFGRMAAPYEDVVVYNQCQRYSEQEIPKIRIEDVLYGSVKPHGKFEVLVWRSQIPPYYSYVCTCEIQDLKTRAAKRKRSMRNGVTLTPC